MDKILKSKSFRDFFGEVTDFELLGHGEYNLNYVFYEKSGEKLVLRIPMGSQMHLENQVRYEYEALRLLEESGRTPVPIYIDDEHGFLVMKFIEGDTFDYGMDLEKAAFCLADIHNHSIPKDNHLIAPKNPFAAVLDECKNMAGVYFSSSLVTNETKQLLIQLLEMGRQLVERADISNPKRCLINTELNSGNFLVKGDIAYLLDWEKPLFACAGQDLGHFLAPTTTLWKTDTVLTEDKIFDFIKVYSNISQLHTNPEELLALTKPYLAINCLRGVTWCSMAWVEYNSPDRVLKDDFTFEKIKTYITPEFLNRIKNEYF